MPPGVLDPPADDSHADVPSGEKETRQRLKPPLITAVVILVIVLAVVAGVLGSKLSNSGYLFQGLSPPVVLLPCPPPGHGGVQERSASSKPLTTLVGALEAGAAVAMAQARRRHSRGCPWRPLSRRAHCVSAVARRGR